VIFSGLPDRLRSYGKITPTVLGRRLAGAKTEAMEAFLSPRATRVLILKADRIYAAILRQYAERALSPAHVTIAGTVATASGILRRDTIDLFVTGLGDTPEGDALDLIAACKRKPFRARKVLVVTMRRDFRARAVLYSLPIDGILDSAVDPPSALQHALEAVAGGSRYWSPAVNRWMRHMATAPTALLHMLTPFEQLVLSVIGDGCDDDEAAERTGLRPATISTVRRDLHRKLGVQHRGELVRVAAQKGFVRFTPDGVERPGFALLSAAYQPRESRRRSNTLAVAAA
jgi:DNA-binding NarL/FixJ family response regulator